MISDIIIPIFLSVRSCWKKLSNWSKVRKLESSRANITAQIFMMSKGVLFIYLFFNTILRKVSILTK